jgi:serine/threonine protein kinase
MTVSEASGGSTGGAAPTGTALMPGSVIRGYRIESVIRQGGFGIVYRAEAVSTRTRELAKSQLGHRLAASADGSVRVALKELFPRDVVERVDGVVRLRDEDISHGGDPAEASIARGYDSFLKGFVSESQFLNSSALDHPNIVRGVELFLENGTAYFAMELIEGEPLGHYLRQRRRQTGEGPPEAELAGMMEPILDALERLHALDQMHRDIKPLNIMRRRDGTLVLIDFGLVGEGLDQIRRGEFSYMVGSPQYAPPEQFGLHEATLDGRRVSFARQGRFTDIYATAAVLYDAIAGKAPGDPGDRVRAVAERGSGADPADLSAHAARYSPRLIEGILAGLALDPAARPQTVDAFREALGWGEGVAIPRVARLPDPDPTLRQAETQVYRAPRQDAPAPTRDPDPAPDPSRRGVLIGAAAAVGAVAIAGGLFVAYRAVSGGAAPGARRPLAVSRDLKTVATAAAGRVRLLDGTSGVVAREIAVGAGIRDVLLSPDGLKLAILGEDGTIRLYDPATGAALRSIDTGSATLSALALDDRTVAAGAADGAILTFGLGDGRRLQRLGGHQGGVTVLAMSEIGSILASGGADRIVRLWHARDGRALGEIEFHREPIVSLAVTPQGDIVISGSADGALRISDRESGAVRQSFARVDGGVGVIAVSRDARRFVTGGAGASITVWDLAAGAQVNRVDGPAPGLAAAAFPAASNRLVALGTGGDLGLYDLDAARRDRTWPPAA